MPSKLRIKVILDQKRPNLLISGRHFHVALFNSAPNINWGSAFFATVFLSLSCRCNFFHLSLTHSLTHSLKVTHAHTLSLSRSLSQCVYKFSVKTGFVGSEKNYFKEIIGFIRTLNHQKEKSYNIPPKNEMQPFLFHKCQIISIPQIDLSTKIGL